MGAILVSSSSRFATVRTTKKLHAGNIAARSVKAGDEAKLHWVAADHEDDRNRRGRRLSQLEP